MIIGILILVTLVLVFFEVLLPGGILGVLAAVSLLIATWLGFSDYGFIGGASVFLGSLIMVALLLFVEFKLLAKTSYGKKFFLDASIEGRSNKAQADESIIGKEGIALTRLNPSGKVSIDGKSYEAYSQDGFLENNCTISVVAQDNFKLIVQKL